MGIERNLRLSNFIWMSLLFFKLSLLLVLNRALTGNSTCSTSEVHPV